MNRAMEIVERLREESKLKKSDVAPTAGERSKYYKNLEADDIKVSVFAEYLKKMGYKIVIVKEGTEY